MKTDTRSEEFPKNGGFHSLCAQSLLPTPYKQHPELRQLISGLWMLQRGRLLNHKTVKPYRTRCVKILRAQNAEISLDGRLWFDRHFPIEVTIAPEALTLIIPN